MDNTFELKCRPDGIIIEKGDKRFVLRKAVMVIFGLMQLIMI